jgi:predicted kinase
MLYPQLEQRLQASKHAVNSATSESIVKQCQEYLALLAEYRNQLYELRGTPGLNQQSPSLTEEVPERK